MTTRRALMKAAASAACLTAPAAWLAGCAAPRVRVDAAESLLDGGGAALTADALVARLRTADYVLLGEQHDNARHHAARAELVRALGVGAVVAEHLPRGQTVVGPQERAAVLTALQAAGFDARGWKWPLHEALFAPLLAAGVQVVGGNAPRELARSVARGGAHALPADLRAVVDAAPLPQAVQAQLDADLIGSHCGQLPASRVANMRWAQRARDASMWLALRDMALPAGQARVLLAGNGHVRADYGVAQLARVLMPGARVVSVGLVDSDAVPAGGWPYDVVWRTAAPGVREDPCAGMVMPAQAAQTQQR